MKSEEARDILTMLKAATAPGKTLEPAEVDVWEESLHPLDADFAVQAVLSGRKTWRYFPSWAQFNDAYQAQRKLAEPVGEQRLNLPSEKQSKTPEWIFIWGWCRNKRSPRQMRPFPQQAGHVDDTDVISQTEYEKLREEWIAAGSPKAENPIPLAR